MKFSPLHLLIICQLLQPALSHAESFDDLFGMDETVDSTDDMTEGEESGEADDMSALFGMEEDSTDVADSDSRWDGFIQFEAAHTYPSPDHTSKLKTTLELVTNGQFANGWRWKASGRASYDAAFDVNNFYSDDIEDDRQLEGAVHEAYVDASFGSAELRLGRQHIVWGEMVGLFFADVVSAKDMRQFVAQDFDLIRIPQWAGRLEYYGDGFHAEMIWIPVMTYNEVGEPGDDFYPLSIDVPSGTQLTVNKDKEPSNSLSNGAFGVRGSMLKNGWDLSAFYYQSNSADPFYKMQAQPMFGPSSKLVGINLTVTPFHNRLEQIGGTLAKDFGAFVLKSEAVFTGDYVVTSTVLNAHPDGIIEQDILDYIVAIEHTTAENTLLNFQFYQRWYSDHDEEGMPFDELESGVSVYTKVELSDRIDAEVTAISQLNRSDWMLRPKLSWMLQDSLELEFGADIFGGDRRGLFGRFDDANRLYTNIRYSF